MMDRPFSPARVRAHRARAAAAGFEGVLVVRVAAELAARLAGVNRSFGAALAIGGAPAFARAVEAEPGLAARLGPITALDADARLFAPLPGAVGDVEALPFADEQFGLVASILTLHWANDLPGALIQIRRALRPDGLMLAALFGGRTLMELREALLIAESDVTGGASPRVAPFADAFDAALLLQRAGFALPVADADTVTLRYKHPLRLIADLRAMGETSALSTPARPLSRAVLARFAEVYRQRFSDSDGRVRATFEILTLTGWAPHESQPKPLKPGS
ncbi:MAG TPA: methyltransferase domain-containing protein, partial [Caulobacterales bacterium]|nr:methyltransferase domain-containing protein [Caulobacterales bacterium]